MPCFKVDTDRVVYAHWLGVAAQKYNVQIHAWVFMTNHVHVLVTPKKDNAISRLMQYLGRFYVRYFNDTYGRSGTLWEGRYFASLIEQDRYFLACQRYIELNPVRAGMTLSPDEYLWSSYHANANGVDSSILTPHPLYLALGSSEKARLKNYREMVAQPLNDQQIKEIRHALNKETILGSERFRQEVENITGQCLRPHVGQANTV